MRSTSPEVISTRRPALTPAVDREIADLKAADRLLREAVMGAKKLRLVTDTIDLDAPQAGLERTLSGIAEDLQQVGRVRRDVRSWALYGAAVSSLLTVAAVALLFWAFMPGAPPPAIVIQPAPVAVVVSPPAAATAAQPKPAAPSVPKTDEPAQPVSEIDLAVRRAFSALWSSRPKTALLETEAVLAAEPNHVDALVAQAFALYDLRRDKAARTTVKKALTLNPKHPLAHVLRGTMAQVDHDVGSALAHYDKYLKARPNSRLAPELHAVAKNLSDELPEAK
jgi:tetratricopeptide (TPR) repeat protein